MGVVNSAQLPFPFSLFCLTMISMKPSPYTRLRQIIRLIQVISCLIIRLPLNVAVGNVELSISRSLKDAIYHIQRAGFEMNL